MLLGNTFPAVLFIIHGGFWTAFGYTIIPSIGAYGAYSTTGVAADGLKEPQFFATFAFSLVAMAIVSTFFTIAGLRTNVVLFVSLALLVPTCKSSARMSDTRSFGAAIGMLLLTSGILVFA